MCHYHHKVHHHLSLSLLGPSSPVPVTTNYNREPAAQLKHTGLPIDGSRVPSLPPVGMHWGLRWIVVSSCAISAIYFIAVLWFMSIRQLLVLKGHILKTVSSINLSIDPSTNKNFLYFQVFTNFWFTICILFKTGFSRFRSTGLLPGHPESSRGSSIWWPTSRGHLDSKWQRPFNFVHWFFAQPCQPTHQVQPSTIWELSVSLKILH